MEYNLFGSASSQDYDIAVKVETIPITDEAHQLCKQLNELLSVSFPDKKINCNLVVVSNGILVNCFKGTEDELNNAILDTYSLHRQDYPCFIETRLKRAVELKISRCIRGLLSMYSRTIWRPEIKQALRSNISEQIKVLNKIDFSSVFPEAKKESLEDIYKMFAFQFGQTFGLIDGKEHYTKETMAEAYPFLESFLFRKLKANPAIFNDCRTKLVTHIMSNYKEILDKNEAFLTENSY